MEDAMSARPVPEGHHTVTPYLIVSDVRAETAFLERAFDATNAHMSTTPDGRVMHAEVQIGDSKVMLGESTDQWPPMPCMLHLYVPDVDRIYKQAVDAGATSLREPADQFYGDRSAGVKDAEGNQWWLATHVEDVSPEEMERRMAARGGS
jgi:PhnB protein